MAQDIEYVANLNLKGNEIKNVVVEVVAEAPTTDSLQKSGRIVSHGGNLYVSDGTKFALLGKSGDVSALTSRVGAIETKNTEQDTAIQQNSTEISSLKTNLATAEGKITTLEGKASTAETNITDLQDRMLTAEGSITSITNTIEAENTGLKALIKANTDAIATKAEANDVYTKEEVNGIKTTLEGSIATKAPQETTYTKTEVDTALASYRKVVDSYTKTEVDSLVNSKVASVYRVKESVANDAALPSSGQVVGDVYNITAAGSYGPAGTNVVWTENGWDALGGTTDLSSYATISYVEGQVSTLEGSIATKVDQTAYNNKITALESKDATQDGLLAGLRTDVDKKVAKTDYDTKVASLESAIGEKAKKVTQTGGTYTKVTVNTEGIVTSGGTLTTSDLPTDMTASLITDFKTAVTKVRHKESFNLTDASTVTVTHDLNVEWPQVAVYRTSTKALIYADVTYDTANTVVISGTAPLGDITVVVSP